MLLVAHTALGIGTGLLIDNPVLAFLVGIITHHLADATPHYDPGSHMPKDDWQAHPIHKMTRFDWQFVSLDVVLTISLLFIYVGRLGFSHWPSLVAGIIGANFPDLIHNVPFWNRRLRQISWIRWWQDHIHRRFHWTVPARQWYIGVATQLVVLILVSWLVYR